MFQQRSTPNSKRGFSTFEKQKLYRHVLTHIYIYIIYTLKVILKSQEFDNVVFGTFENSKNLILSNRVIIKNKDGVNVDDESPLCIRVFSVRIYL